MYHAQSVKSTPDDSGKFQEESRPPVTVAARSAAGGIIGVRTTLQCVPFLAVFCTACRCLDGGVGGGGAQYSAGKVARLVPGAIGLQEQAGEWGGER